MQEKRSTPGSVDISERPERLDRLRAEEQGIEMPEAAQNNATNAKADNEKWNAHAKFRCNESPAKTHIERWWHEETAAVVGFTGIIRKSCYSQANGE